MLSPIPGTSSWSLDYFSKTTGVSLTLIPCQRDNLQSKNQTSKDIGEQLVDVFNRDWSSKYCKILE
jgi:hypothetical protein